MIETEESGIAENGKKAFEIAETLYHPQIVFCDVVLGMENGVLSVILLRSIFLRLRPIFYPNYCGFQMIRHSMDAGVEECYINHYREKSFPELIERNNASSLNEEEKFTAGSITCSN